MSINYANLTVETEADIEAAQFSEAKDSTIYHLKNQLM